MEHVNENRNVIEHNQRRSVSEEQRLREAFSKLPYRCPDVKILRADTRWKKLAADKLEALNKWDGQTIIVGSQAIFEVLLALELFPMPSEDKGYLFINDWYYDDFLSKEVDFVPTVSLIDEKEIEERYGLVFEPSVSYIDKFSYTGKIPDSMAKSMISNEFCSAVFNKLQDQLFSFSNGNSISHMLRDVTLNDYDVVRALMHEMAQGSNLDELPDWKAELEEWNEWKSEAVEGYEAPDDICELNGRISEEIWEAWELMTRYLELLELWDAVSDREMISGRADASDLSDDKIMPRIVGRLREALCMDSIIEAWGRGVPAEDILA